MGGMNTQDRKIERSDGSGGFNLELRESGRLNAKELPDRDLTAGIIQAAIAVHRTLGPGFLESLYEEALCIELAIRNMPFERQKSIRLTYAGKPIGEHRLDLLVAERVVVELKAIVGLEPVHFSVVRSYMKATNVDSGLLLNFAAMPLTIKRVGREHSPLPDFLSSL
jgi:GxxExxY protein